MRSTLATAVACVATFGASPLLADVVTFGAMKDNTLYEDPFGTISNGSGEGMFVGRTSRTGLIRRALVAFDIAANVPAGSTITRIEVTLNATRAHGGASTIGLHRVLANWGEGASHAGSSSGGSGDTALPGDATWLNTFAYNQFWAIPGGDYNTVASGSKSITGVAEYQWNSTPALVADAQQWLDTPLSNYGWLMRAATEVSGTAKRFATRENETLIWRPKVLVEYTPVPTPGAGLALAVGVLAHCSRRRR